MMLPEITQWTTPVFSLVLLAEIVLARVRRKAEYDLHDTFGSMMIGAFYPLTAVAGAIGTYIALEWVYQHRVATMGWGIAAWVSLFFINDLLGYFQHRWSHEWRVWWAVHVVHHSSRHFNLSVNARQPWFAWFLLGWVLWLPLAWIGFHPAMIVFMIGVSAALAYLVHTEHVGRLPRWIEFVFVTPSHHRVHHASNLRYLDANYGITLIIWDRLFGTFIGESNEEPCRYGLVRDIVTVNPWRVNVFEWISLWRDMRSTPSWSTRLRYLFARPGWRHDGQGKTTSQLREIERQSEQQGTYVTG